ncbi:MAG: hypothetical protein ABSH44_06255 [Bryobacteraceae bacterium]
MRIFMLAPAVAALFAAQLPAQDTTELLNRMKAMEDRIKALEAEVQTLKVQPPGTVAAAAPAAAPALPAVPVEAAAQGPPPGAPLTLGGAGPAAAKVLNPDISVIGDFLGAAGNGANRGAPSLEMHESEVGFQEVIDPYARADFFISFGEHGVDLEEGYLTFTALPAGMQLKVGKMRAAFGRVNPLHNHVLPWTDRPLVNQDLVNGEDGIDDAGLSLSRILPAPKGIFLEGTAQVFRGDTDGVFRADQRSHVSTVEHLRLYRDLAESTNIDLGGSFARGHSPFGDGWNQLYGTDATLRWKPLRRSIYHSFVARSELIWARTVLAPVRTATLSLNRGIITPFGFYVSGDYQFARRWFLGARFDRSQRGNCLPTNPATTTSCNMSLGPLSLLQDTGGSLLLTYWPSEFSQIRGQLRRTQYGEGLTANELLFQFQFSMGAHGAHPF